MTHYRLDAYFSHKPQLEDYLEYCANEYEVIKYYGLGSP